MKGCLPRRAAIIDLETLSLAETEPADRKLDDVLLRGGFPELHANPDIDTAVFYSGYLDGEIGARAVQDL